MKGPAMRRAHKSESTFQQTGLSLNPPEVVSAAAATATILLPLVFLRPSIREEANGQRADRELGGPRGPNQRRARVRARARARDEAPLIVGNSHTRRGGVHIRRILLV